MPAQPPLPAPLAACQERKKMAAGGSLSPSCAASCSGRAEAAPPSLARPPPRFHCRAGEGRRSLARPQPRFHRRARRGGGGELAPLPERLGAPADWAGSVTWAGGAPRHGTPRLGPCGQLSRGLVPSRGCASGSGACGAGAAGSEAGPGRRRRRRFGECGRAPGQPPRCGRRLVACPLGCA